MTGDGDVALGPAATGTLAGFLVLAAAVWVGGIVAIVVVARVARQTLEPSERVPFFRGLGRAFGPVGGLALMVALGCGAGLLGGRRWTPALTAAVVLAACLLAVTGIGIVQARRMTRLRQAVLASPDDTALSARVRRGALGAAVVRSAIAALSLALIAVGVLLGRG